MKGWGLREDGTYHRSFPLGSIEVYPMLPDQGTGWAWGIWLRQRRNQFVVAYVTLAEGPVEDQEGLRPVLATPEEAAEAAYRWWSDMIKQVERTKEAE